MNLYRIINDIKSTCMSHRDVQDFHYGDIYDYENTKSLKYINTNFTLQSITSGLESDTKTINGVLFCVDRLTDNGDNKLIAQSRCTDILESIINRLTENYSGWSLENTVYEVFSTKFADLCAGCFCTFSLSVDEDSVCSDDEFIVKSKEINGNGIYDVIGYDRIIVDVQPKLKEVEIVKNGVYLPEKDSDGYNKITVNVPPTPTQEKSVNITENGTQRIVPDSGYNLSGVDVNVNVAPNKSVINVEQIQFTNASVIDNNIEIVGLKNCYDMFSGCKSLTSIPAINTSNVTNMGYMFRYCSRLTSIPALDTINVTNMYMMFDNCSSLTSIPAINTSNVTNMSSMFTYCSSLTSIPAINTSNVTNMANMFNSCYNITSIPELDTSKVTNMSSMFTSCSSLTSIPAINTSKVTNMGSMFSSCYNITSIPELDTSKVTNMSSMFNSCSSLTSIPAINTSNVTNMGSMFYNCSSLTSIPALDTSNVTNTQYMFLSCPKLTDLGGFTNLGKAFTSSQTLYISSTSILTNQSVQNIIDTVFDMNLNTKGGRATLKLSQTVIDAMTDEQKSQLAAKGWTLTN